MVMLTLNDAKEIVGNQPTTALYNMIEALDGPLRYKNTEEEWQRLEAARIVLRNRNTLRVVCVECEREFNLVKEDEAQEWYNGHDCEV